MLEMKYDSSVTAPGVTLGSSILLRSTDYIHVIVPPTSCSRSVIRVSLFDYRLLNIVLVTEIARFGWVANNYRVRFR